ncbi:ABC transporter permease [Dethiobacter alkaliphilus]|uniref:ABC transporter permease n=1 Tax=Dethiobacter alkaliphilus TaxID=427926 RepID=UPI0022264DFC|nr:ABC transporter permease subunit [Dethiobacter alkaliphilus]MCW3489066.1 ABC transporter permease subunit [Dethiobacter alkaliphilus]
MREFPDFISTDLGSYVARFFDWLVDYFAVAFDSLSSALLSVLLLIEGFLLWLPWWVLLIAVFVLALKLVSPRSAIVFVLMLVLVGSFGYWVHMMYTLSLVIASVLVSLLVGLPVGILMAYSNTMETILTPILDGMQTMPSLVYLIPAMLMLGMGIVPGVFATMLFAVPPVIRLTSLAIRTVSEDMVEAAASFGSSPWQLLVKVQIPQALPTIMAGINQTTMMALSMVVIASMIGVKGLGMEVLIAINRLDVARGVEAGLGIVILAVIIDRLSQGIARRFKVPD